MDPNANLEEQLETARRMLEEFDQADGVRLAELVLSMDQWIHNGGALPQRWEGVHSPPVAHGDVSYKRHQLPTEG